LRWAVHGRSNGMISSTKELSFRSSVACGFARREILARGYLERNAASIGVDRTTSPTFHGSITSIRLGSVAW
jgi:hypothetical protein